jgi:hypothetical protein
VFACLASLLLCSQGEAAVNILAYSQSSGVNTVTLTNNGMGGETITSTNTPVIIGTFDGAPADQAAFLTLSATSVPGTFTNSAGALSEAFTGSFSITSGPGDTGLNFLSGTFTDTLTGTVGGVTLSLRVDSTVAGEALHYTSSFPLPLGPPQGMSLSFTNVTPAVNFFNNSIGVSGTTTMQQSGVFSATTVVPPVPEPSTFVIAGIGGLGLIGYGLRRRRAPGA